MLQPPDRHLGDWELKLDLASSGAQDSSSSKCIIALSTADPRHERCALALARTRRAARILFLTAWGLPGWQWLVNESSLARRQQDTRGRPRGWTAC
jgi:hypothetical protein